MTDLTRTLREITSLFDQMGLTYAVMGGMAVRVYGIPRPTYDIDFTVAIDRGRLPDLYAAVAALGYTVPEAHQGGWVDQVAGLPLIRLRLYLEGRGVDVDLFLCESPFQNALLARRRLEQIDGLRVWFVSPEDLILLKLLAHRPRDMADIGDILFTQGQLDEAYLRQWAKELAVDAELEDVLRNVA
jgi:predicted nucleotidyltransferase